MSNTAKRLNEYAISQEAASVLRADDGALTVQADGTPYRARRAVGCLVQPEVGDRVLVAVGARDAWVLTVLDREPGSTTRITAEGDLEVSLPAGRLAIVAESGVDVVSGAPVSVVAGAFRIHAGEGEVSVQGLSLFAGTVDACAERVKLVAGVVDQTLDQLTQRMKRAYRFVEEFDQLRAGRIDYVAKKLLELHGATATVTAEALVKVDAGQVHIG